ELYVTPATPNFVLPPDPFSSSGVNATKSRGAPAELHYSGRANAVGLRYRWIRESARTDVCYRPACDSGPCPLCALCFRMITNRWDCDFCGSLCSVLFLE